MITYTQRSMFSYCPGKRKNPHYTVGGESFYRFGLSAHRGISVHIMNALGSDRDCNYAPSVFFCGKKNNGGTTIAGCNTSILYRRFGMGNERPNIDFNAPSLKQAVRVSLRRLISIVTMCEVSD